MKKKHFNSGLFSAICIQLVTCFHPARAQHYYRNNSNNYRPTYRRNKDDDRYTSWYVSTGGLFSENKPSDIAINLPYSSYNLNGGIHSNGPFSGGGKNLFPHNYWLTDFFHWSLGRRKLFYDFGMGCLNKLNPSDKSLTNTFFCNTGMGANIKLGRQARFLLKPSINISYNDYSATLGQIDNRDSYIDVLGFTANPNYTWYSKHSSHFANATNLTFALEEQCVNVYPKLTFCSNPSTHKFYWGIDVAYYIPIYRKENLYLYQNGDDKSTRDVGNVNLSDSRINLYYNNNKVTQTSLNFNKLYVGVSIGFNFK